MRAAPPADSMARCIPPTEGLPTMTRKQVCAAAAAALASAALPLTATAADAPPATTAKFLSKIVRDGKAATLKVRYSCDSGSVLWISAKQVKSRKKDKALKAEGSSQISAAWWQSHRNKITCDGKSHTARFTLDKVEKGSKGKLRTGQAWVQFCVTEGKALTVSKSGWVAVR
jgi:hypothetical protein